MRTDLISRRGSGFDRVCGALNGMPTALHLGSGLRWEEKLFGKHHPSTGNHKLGPLSEMKFWNQRAERSNSLETTEKAAKV